MKNYTNKTQDSFTMVANKAINDERLSWKAKGILAYLLSKKTGWNFYESEIQKNSIDGLASVQTGLKELMNFGYLKREPRTRNEKGQLGGTKYEIFGKANIGKSNIGKSTAINTNSNKTNKTLSKDKGINTSKEEDSTLPTIQESPLNKSNGVSKTYGDPTVNEAFSQWENIVGYKITQRIKANRRAAYTLTKKFGLEAVVALLPAVAVSQTSKYAPAISDFTELQSKLDKLRVWIKKNNEEKGEIQYV